MKKILLYFITVCIVSFLVSCEDITKTNINPNAIDPLTVDPNLMMPNFIVGTMKNYLEEGYDGNCAGVVQYMQKSGWSGGLNSFDWVGQKDWDGIYGHLRNIQHFYNRSVELGYEFHQGVGLVMRAFNFGFLADGYGDIPYKEALSPVSGGTNILPAFDAQEDVYKGIIEELKQANTLLSKGSIAQYTGVPVSKAADVLYGFNPEKWRKLANSLMLRYYMRLSVKLPAYAEDGIKKMMTKQNEFPLFEANDDDAILAYLGTGADNAWKGNLQFDSGNDIYFYRLQLCAGFRDVLVDFKDPRLPRWFNKVVRKISIDESPTAENDVIVDGVRYLSRSYITNNDMVIYDKNTWVSAVADRKQLVDTMSYVGIPICAFVGDGAFVCNLNPTPDRGGANVHVSALADMYSGTKGEFLNMRMITYAEVCFILAEAAQKGWISGTQDWYEKGVRASLDYWKVGGYNTYIQNPGVAFNSAKALEQIITQKWIANWNIAVESWCDWRRTGLPKFSYGDRGVRNAMPIRFRYGANESSRNKANYEVAKEKLVTTTDSNLEKDSAWSIMWLLQ